MSEIKILEPEIQDQTEIRPKKGWGVVVFNDNHHTFLYVIEALCKILSIGVEEANNMAQKIHTEGEALVAGPMSKYEASSISNKIASYGPDPYSIQPKKNIGLKTSIKEID